jgi:TPR repeat protein
VTAPKTEAEKQEELKRTIAFQQRCAEQGKPTFQYDLGLRYLKGDGVEQNLETARKWLKLAADRGHSGAKKKLEEMEKEKAPAPAE